MFAVRGPGPAGVNVTPRIQFVPALMPVAQVLFCKAKSAAFVPAMEILEMVKNAEPILESATI